MTPKGIRIVSAVCVIFGLAAQEAGAWGPKAQEAIANTALQVIQRSFPRAFRMGDTNYESEVVRGAVAGVKSLPDAATVKSDEQALITVGNELQLLRAVRAYGISRYFAYRMGVLSALMSELCLPYSLGGSDADLRLKLAMAADIDKHVLGYRFAPDSDRTSYIRNPTEYFHLRRKFFENGKTMIALDYGGGKGYDGYLKQGGPVFFEAAVRATADAWYTVLRTEGDPSDVAPSNTALTWYFAREMEYLLTVRKNLREAEKVYANFERVNPGLGETYETVGDYFYQAGAKERGVAEWINARGYAGAQRERVSEKLSNHYYQLGLELLDKGKAPRSPEETLPEGQRALEHALQYAKESGPIAEQLGIIKRLISEKNARRDNAVNIIAAAEKVMKQAEQSGMAGDYANAIATYNSAASLFEAVDDEFASQNKSAKAGISEVKKQINKIIVDVLDKAADQCDLADRAMKENRFDEAAQLFASVESIVGVVSSDPSTTQGKERADRIERANKGKRANEDARKRYNDAQEAARIAAEQGQR